MTPADVVIVALAVVAGALIKSVTGIGLPTLAIPVLAVFVGTREAIVVMTIPTVVTNTVLLWAYRDAARAGRHLTRLLVAGTVGVPVGVYALTQLDAEAVGVVLAVTVLLYVAVAVFKPGLSLSPAAAAASAAPVGLVGGVLQGATGLSSAVLAPYVHALKLDQRGFVFTIAAMFQVFAVIQMIGFWVAGAYTASNLGASLLATAVASVVLAAGARLSGRLSPVVFNNLVLAVLTASAVKLLADALL